MAGGTAVFAAGGAEGKVGQEYFDILNHDKRVFGSNWFSNEDIDELIALIGAGVIDMSYLKHKEFKLADFNDTMPCSSWATDLESR